MATSASVLKGALKPEIKSEIEAFFGTPSNATKLDEFCDALAGSIATKVLEHLVGNAEIQPGTFTSPAGAVTGVGAFT